MDFADRTGGREPELTARWVGPGPGSLPGHVLALLDQYVEDAFLYGILPPPVCPGRTCLLHDLEHQHAGRPRRDGR